MFLIQAFTHKSIIRPQLVDYVDRFFYRFRMMNINKSKSLQYFYRVFNHIQIGANTSNENSGMYL